MGGASLLLHGSSGLLALHLAPLVRDGLRLVAVLLRGHLGCRGEVEVLLLPSKGLELVGVFLRLDRRGALIGRDLVDLAGGEVVLHIGQGESFGLLGVDLGAAGRLGAVLLVGAIELTP